MLTTFANRARMTTATTGTGTLTLGSALAGYLSFAEAGVASGATVSYVIEDGNNIEIGRGVYTASGTTLTRNVIASKIHGEALDTTPISLSGSAKVFLTLLAEDIRNLTGPYFNVQEFGATGDGTTDDSAAIQAALDAAAAGSQKRVYVPHTANGYAIGATLTIDEGVTIFGDNLWGQERSRIKPRPGFTSPLLRTEDYGVTRKLRVGIVGLFFDGSSTTLTAIQANIQESLIQNCTIKNCFTYGIHFGGISSGPTAQALNNHILDNYLAGQIGVTEFFDGIFIDYFSADNTIERNYIEASRDAGIRSRGYNNKITNNHIYSVAGTGGGVGAGIYTETSADHDISQNYIELCAAEGVLMQGGGSDVATLAAAVHGNVFRNVDTGNTSNGVIEIAGSDVSAVSVSGNVVRRDAATSYATPYFVYFNGITPARAKVFGNEWQAGLIATAETNISAPLADYFDLAEIAAPASPASNVARAYATDDGTGVTTLAMKDSAGNVVPLSHFLQAGTGATTRTQQAKARDLLTVKDFGAVGDGTTNDTAAITAADAITDAKYVPSGVYDITLAATDLDGPYWGRGQIRDSAENKRGPWFSAIKAAPASLGNHDSVSTAFNGDLLKLQIAMEHRITGAATLGQPTTGYVYTPEAYAQYGFLYNESGHNQGTATNDGRTAACFHRVRVVNVGQGDCVAYNASAFVNATRSGSTDVLANPAASLFNGDMTAGQAGVYLNPGEFFLADNGVDAAAAGWVVNLERTVATGAKGAFWFGFRSQSVGSADVNSHFSAVGQCDVGLDFSHITTDASKAAVALKADDRIYGNSSSSNSRFATALGDDYLTFASGLNAWNFIVDGGSVLQVYSNQVVSQQSLKSNHATGGIGYATGAGGTVVQATSKSTGVTLNRACGQITMNNAALAAGAIVGFVATNSAVAATDMVVATHVSGGTAGSYRIAVDNIAAGSFAVRVTNISGGSLSEAIVIGFTVLKGATA